MFLQFQNLKSLFHVPTCISGDQPADVRSDNFEIFKWAVPIRNISLKCPTLFL